MRQARTAAGASADIVEGGAGAWIEFYRAVTRAVAAAGVPILIGTDTPNPLLVPGFSLHHELQALVRAGLDPAFVLRAATHGAAVHVGGVDEFGRIRPGLRADIVLLGGNPLEDLSHLRDVRGLVLRGEWHARARLEGMLDDVAALRRR
jgi:imidazolonepropionase-like amidohydrolase